MPVLSVGEIVSATGGRLQCGSETVPINSYSIDTRTVSSGSAFFALKGMRADGHDFLGAAAAAGAGVAVVNRNFDGAAPDAVVVVDDVEQALTACGKAAREKSKARFVALSGSTGKTTTKELIAAALATTRRVHRTPGNLNNHLGVPLSLLACPDDAEFAVIELGMSAPGEIAALTKLVDPHVGLVTNISPAHMQYFSSIDDVAAAKGELFAMLRPEATSVVNLDDDRVRVQACRHAGPRVTFGRRSTADVVLMAVDDRFVPGATMTVRRGSDSRRLSLRLGGAHNARNALAALATVLACEAPLEPALEALAAVEAGPGRGQVHQLAAGIVIVDDCYNSSPRALGRVLETIANSEPEGRKILVMGDMLELGAREAAFHREAGRAAAGAGVQILVGVGTRVRVALEAARKAGVPETRHEKTARAAAEILPGLMRPGDLLVIKGSRGIKLELVVESLLRTTVETH